MSGNGSGEAGEEFVGAAPEETILKIRAIITGSGSATA
jgi:hypothetical protein